MSKLSLMTITVTGILNERNDNLMHEVQSWNIDS